MGVPAHPQNRERADVADAGPFPEKLSPDDYTSRLCSYSNFYSTDRAAGAVGLDDDVVPCRLTSIECSQFSRLV